MDPECEYTVAAHEALAGPGAPVLPPFPRVGRVAQRLNDWDFYNFEPTKSNQQGLPRVGVNTGHRSMTLTGPEDEREGISQEHASAPYSEIQAVPETRDSIKEASP